MQDKNLKLEFDAFLRSFKQNVDQQYSFLLGAGCSISSGVPSAYTCIWDWKKQIYETNNPRIPFVSIESDNDKREIQRWCDLQPGFPPLDSDEEYSFYAEKAFPIDIDRIAYFQDLFNGKRPGIGYKLLAFLAKENLLQSVWTTNFDGFAKKAAEDQQVTVYPISLDNSRSIYQNLSRSGLKYIALHGDYKYSTKLKNTGQELDKQENFLIDAMKPHLAEKHLIVIGYSGRDKSLMRALHSVYSQNGGGRLFWLGMESEPSKIVHELLCQARKSGRDAYYVQAKGFDETLLQMATVAFGNSESFQSFAQENIEIKPDQTIEPFKLKEQGNIIKYATTNLVPVVVPDHCYTFTLKKSDEYTDREIIDKFTHGKMIATILFKGKVYAIGSMTDIYSSLNDFLEGIPTLVSLTEDAYIKSPLLKILMLKAIVLGIARKTGLKMSFQGRLWDENIRYYNRQGIYECVKVNLRLNPHQKFMYLSISPTLYFDKDPQITQLSKQDMCRSYIDGLRNKKYFDKVQYWLNKLFGRSRMEVNYSEKTKEFRFIFSPNTACCQIFGDGNYRICQQGFDVKRIRYSATKIIEPLLMYSNNQGNYVSDTNPMRGLIRNAPFDLPIFALPPTNIRMRVICPMSWGQRLHDFLLKLNSGNIRPRYDDYIQLYPEFSSVYKVGLDIPHPSNKEAWVTCNDEQNDGYVLAKNICTAIEKLSEKDPNAVIIIFVPTNWSSVKSFKVQGIDLDFHDYIKSYCAQRRITTQFIEERTVINRQMECEILWWLSLAIFVKSGRTPWSLGSLNQNTAYAGIGYSVNQKSADKQKVVIGCSHIYNSQGQGLKFRLRKIDNPIIDKKNNPFLSRDEAYKLGLNIVELFRESMYKAPKRVVIHKRTIFKQEEIDGLVAALSPHVDNIELLTIEDEKDFKLMPGYMGNPISPEGYPIERGTCLVIDENKALLWTHGVVDSVHPGKSFYQGGKGIPMPLRITRCYGNSDIEDIASEILSFTKINWNSFYFYSKMPATIDTSNIVAKVGSLLQHFNGNTFDYKYFI